MSEDVGSVATIKEGHVLVITVDRQAKLNAVTPEIFDGISDALQQLEDDHELRVGTGR